MYSYHKTTSKPKKKRGQVTISIVYTSTCRSIWFLLNPLLDPYTLRSPRLTASTSSELGLFLLVRLEASYESLICFIHSLCVT